MRTIDWSKYKQVTETVPEEDGGGYRIWFPTLGYAVYGVGDSLLGAIRSLADSKGAFEDFIQSMSDYKIPEPTEIDLRAQLESPKPDCPEYAYAA